MSILELAFAWLLGSILGMVTGLVPGLHVNTLAAMGLAFLPQSPLLGHLLLAIAIVHSIVTILPSTYLGVPSQEDVLVQLPAHALYHEGKSRLAIRTSVQASWMAGILAILLGWPYLWLLVGTPELLKHSHRAVPFVLPAVLVFLILQEHHRGVRAMTWALAIQALSFLLAWWALAIPVRSPLPVAPSMLLPLLGGSFGAAGMIEALRTRTSATPQGNPGRTSEERASTPVMLGVLASGLTAVLPGLTGSVAGSFVPRRRRGDLRVHAIRVLSAIDTTHTMLGLLVMLGSSRVRSGLALATKQLIPHAFWFPGPELPNLEALEILATMLVALMLGSLATLAMEPLVARHGSRLPVRGLGVATLVVLTTLTALTTGWIGLVVLAAATALGLWPLRVGVRRVHLLGSLIGLASVRAILS